MYKEGSEHFAISKDSYPMDFQRRQILTDMLDSGAKQPGVVEKGLDTESLTSRFAEIGAEDPKLSAESNSFLSKFDPNIKYIPAIALESYDGELRPELEEVKAYLPHLFISIKQLVKEAGLESGVEPNTQIIIGVEKKQQDEKSEVLGGFHSPLTEQGYKFLDKIVMATLENGTDNRPAYRVANVLRAITHDSIHAVQYILFVPYSWSDESSEESLAELKESQAELGTNMGYPRYATVFKDVDAKLKDFKGRESHVAFGGVLFEYVTDKVARRLVKEYMAKINQGLPLPQTKFEELEYRDFEGKILTESDLVGLKDHPDAKIAKNAFEYSAEINEPAEYFFNLLGSYAQEAEEAIFQDSITGKFTKVLALQKKIAANDYKTPEGQPLDIAEIRKFIEASMVLKAMFRDLK